MISCIADDTLFVDFRSSSAINVLDPAPGQSFAKVQHCSISTQLAVGIGPGDQIRIVRSPTEYALYTISEVRNELGPDIVRMSAAGRARLGTNNPFAGALDTEVAASELSDVEAQAQSEFVERLVDDGFHTGLLAAAAHGGKIEVNTDEQAEYLAALLPGISSWICKGWRNPTGAFNRWHIDSSELSPNSFPGLGAIADRGFTHVVSFHGMSEPGVLIGGRASLELRETLRAAIVDAIGDPSVPIVVSGDDGPLSGVGASNFVNWLTAGLNGGIQIEQSLLVRTQYWAAVVEAVASVMGPLIDE